MRPALLSDPALRQQAMKPVERRQFKNQAFIVFCSITALLSLLILAVLLGTILTQGWPHLDFAFLRRVATDNPEQSGIKAALIGTIAVCGLCALLTLPLGVATALYLNEFQPKGAWAKRVKGFVELNISNLAGVPSVVYGILALTAFVDMFGFGSKDSPVFEIGASYYYQYFNESRRGILVPVESRESPAPELASGMPAQTPSGKPIDLNVIPADAPWPEDESLARQTVRESDVGGPLAETSWYHFRLPFGKSILSMSLALMLVVLPILITASQEALKAVPQSLRDGAFGLGATRWQTIWRVTLPAATPGIMTGSIISMSRAIGEAAPIVIISGTIFMSFLPDSLMSDTSVMPLQIFHWAKQPKSPDHSVQFTELAATGIIVLLAVLLAFNALAVFLRQKLEKPLT